MKKTNRFKLLGTQSLWLCAIALAAVIGFGMVSCGGGDSPFLPKNPPEVAHYSLINLKATKWENADGSAEQWASGTQIKLSDFTTVKPTKIGDVLKFRISGNASEQIKNCEIIIFQMQGNNWDTFRWLGGSPTLELPNPFKDFIFESTIWVAPLSNVVIYVEIQNTLWQKDSSGAYTYNSGQKLPPGTQNDDVMATINNFSISLVVDPPEGGGGVPPTMMSPVPNGDYLHSTGNYTIRCYPGQNAGDFILFDNATDEDPIEGTYTFNGNNMKINFVFAGGFTFTAAFSSNGRSFTVSGITDEEKAYLNGIWSR